MFASLLFICFQTPTQMQFFELWFSIRKMITLMLIDWLLIQILATARRNRITFGTQMNQHSSRSHALLCITVQGTDLATGSKTTGQLLMHFWFKMERLHKGVKHKVRGSESAHQKRQSSPLDGFGKYKGGNTFLDFCLYCFSKFVQVHPHSHLCYFMFYDWGTVAAVSY